MLITKANVNEYNVTGEFDIAFSVRADEDSKEKKSGTLRFKMDNVPLVNIIGSSLKDKRINEQVKMRTNFTSLTDGAIITVNYEGGRAPVDPVAAFKARFAAANAAERAAMIAELQAIK